MISQAGNVLIYDIPTNTFTKSDVKFPPTSTVFPYTHVEGSNMYIISGYNNTNIYKMETENGLVFKKILTTEVATQDGLSRMQLQEEDA